MTRRTLPTPLLTANADLCRPDAADVDSTIAESQPVYRFSVPGHPPGPNDRLCWQARRRMTRPLAEAIGWQARAVAVGLPEPLQRAHVVATLVYRRRPFRDYDNAVACLKACLDALVTSGLLVSDRPDRLSLDVRQELGARRAVLLVVRPAACVECV